MFFAARIRFHRGRIQIHNAFMKPPKAVHLGALCITSVLGKTNYERHCRESVTKGEQGTRAGRLSTDLARSGRAEDGKCRLSAAALARIAAAQRARWATLEPKKARQQFALVTFLFFEITNSCRHRSRISSIFRSPLLSSRNSEIPAQSLCPLKS